MLASPYALAGECLLMRDGIKTRSHPLLYSLTIAKGLGNTSVWI